MNPAPFLPMSRAEMDQLGWENCDVILVTGDAYIDHPAFGMALIGRLLESLGLKVGIIAQPDWNTVADFQKLGRPNLFFGVTAGNMDSMVNRYTANRKIRSDDAYSPGGQGGKRPDRASIVYSQRCREAFKGVPIVLGGIEASLRRIAHYDYWSDTVRRSILLDAKGDLLLYGNAEAALTELVTRLQAGEAIGDIGNVRGTARLLPKNTPLPEHVALPPFEAVRDDPATFAQADHLFHRETNPFNARPLAQRHGERIVWINPPPLPLETTAMDRLYALPFARRPHPSYGQAHIPAYEMIKFSIAIQRGCFGGCTFCSITEHEGRIIQNRSQGSIVREVEEIRAKTPGYTGYISDLGGPTANMYRLHCSDPKIEAACRRPACVHPDICEHLNTDHTPLIELYRAVRAIPHVHTVTIGSGVRYDLALRSPEYVEELVRHHVGGYLKVAPEHTEKGVLDCMLKPGIEVFDRFDTLFKRLSKKGGKEQYLIPYFIAGHPGTTDTDMVNLAVWLKRHRYRVDQVQTFLPSPMAIATAMYHTGRNTLKKSLPPVEIPKRAGQRALHKALLRYHDPKNWPLIRGALLKMGRKDLIGVGRGALVPPGVALRGGSTSRPSGGGSAGRDTSRALAPRGRRPGTAAKGGRGRD